MRHYKVYFVTLLVVASFAASVFFRGGTRYSIGQVNLCGVVDVIEGSGGCGGSGTTAPTVPTTPPTTVSSTNPVNGTTGVAINRKIAATFSEEMNPLTITTATFLVTGPGTTPVAGAVALDPTNRTAIFIPSTNLAPNTLFTATITTGAQGLTCNPLAGNFVWSFTTGATADSTPPVVTFVNPADGAQGVCTNNAIAATFSEAMDASTITTATFQVTGPGTTPVTGTVAYDLTSNIATFTPANNLAANTLFTATITTGATDLAGNAMAANKVWTFTTGTTTCSPAPLNPLGRAASFGGFGGSAGMTNQGILTVINGDIGTTAVSTAVTGFHDNSVPYMSPLVSPPAGAGCTYTETTLNIGAVNCAANGVNCVNGETRTTYTAPPPPTVACPNEGTMGTPTSTFEIATQALADALTAYNALVALPPGPDPGAGQLGGLTLAPGVYTAAAGSFMITGSDLTLDAQGDPNAVFVFQMASSLTVGAAGAPRSVILINGAQAKNVFWQVGSAATINAAGGGTMVGTIISQSGAAFSTAGNTTIVTLNGRVLSLVASVTLVNTVINVPAP